MKKIGDFLKSFAVRKRIARPMQAVEVCTAASKIGRQTAPQFWAKSFKKGILTVETKDAVDGQRLEMQIEKIKRELNAKLGSSVIKTVRIKVRVGGEEGGS